MSEIKKYDFVDQARGLAILMVLGLHSTPHLHYSFYGQMGVQLFFIASAFTLCNSFSKRSSEPHATLAFFIRRFFRIAPLYYLGMLFYFSIFLWAPTSTLSQVLGPYAPGNVATNLLFIHGFIPKSNNNIVPGGWSVGTEMAFYLLFPFIFRFIHHKVANRVRFLIILTIVAELANLAVQTVLLQIHHQGTGNNSFMYFNLINQFPVFLLGILLYFLLKHSPHSRLAQSSVLSFGIFVLFSAVSVSLFLINTPIAFAVIPSLSGISFVFLVNFLRLKQFSIPVLSRIGQVSYSMYIIHFFFVWLIVPPVIDTFLPNLGANPRDWLVFLTSATVCFLLALLTEKWVEQPGIQWGKALIGRMQKIDPADHVNTR